MNNPTGKLSLLFGRKKNGTTYLKKQYFKLPLQIMTPYYPDKDGTAFLYMLNPSGGILQHDRLLTEIELEEGSRALVTTPSSTKFYKMDDGHAEILNEITVGKDAVLEYLPEYNVPFAQSTTEQTNIFMLSKDSVLIASDMVTSGRVSRGEIFQFNKYSTKTSIYIDGRLVTYDRSVIEPKKLTPSVMGVMENFLSCGTMYIYKEVLPKELADEINAVDLGNNVKLGATVIEKGLILVRIMGEGAQEMQDTMLKVWEKVRQSILNKNSVRIRKY